jgi:hypothetical protein
VKDIGLSLLDDNLKLSQAGDMMFSLFGMFAESEIKQKKERFSRAKKSLMEMGLSISGKTLFGYKRVEIPGTPKRTTLDIDKKNSKVVKDIFKWYLNGSNRFEKRMSIKKIALECIKLGYPKYTHSKRNINKLLKEEGYTGLKTTSNKRKNIYYQDGGLEEKYFVSSNTIKYPVIIDRATFDLCQIRLKENNSRVDKSTKNITILSKLVKCNICDSHYTANYRKIKEKSINSYRCSSRSSAKGCMNKQSVSMSMLDSAIWCFIKTDLPTLSNVISKYNPDVEITELKQSLDELYKKDAEIDTEINEIKVTLNSFQKVKNVSTADFIQSIASKVAKLDKEKGEIQNEISRIKSELTIKSEKFDNIYKSINKNIKPIEASKELLKKYINLFIQRINILYHSHKFSVIYVSNTPAIARFKIIQSMEKINKKASIKEITAGASSLLNTYIILDKSNSQNIIAYKTNQNIKIDKLEDTISVTSLLGKKETKIHLSELTSAKYNKMFNQYEFSKLSVY